jgi:5-methylthioadenosine/S-adenosylhomocysteine deaminase
MTDILIKDGFIATMDESGTVYRRGSIYVEDGYIVAVGKDIESPTSPEYVIDATSKVVLPGFVNVHSHLQQYFRGLYELIGDFYTVNLPLEGYRHPKDMESLGLASCAEYIYGGSTTSMVIYTYPEGFAIAAEKAGTRNIIGGDIEEVDLNKLMHGVYEYLPEKGHDAYKRAIELHRRWHGKAEGRIKTIMAPKAADLTRQETYLKCKDYAEEHDLKITTHLSQSWREIQQVNKLYGMTPPQLLHQIGIIKEGMTGAHCTYTTESDLRLITESGMGILHCRAVKNPLLRWMDMDIPMGLGTDDYNHDMLGLIRENITGQRRWAKNTGGYYGRLYYQSLTVRPTPYELLELATRRGAEVLGIDGEVGSLERGKKADIITINLHIPYIPPTKDPLTSIILYGNPSDIDNVMVEGRFLKKDGKLTTINMEEALQTAQIKVEEIVQDFFDDHPLQHHSWRRKIPY